MTGKLSIKDLEILIDALDVWEDSCDHSLMGMIGKFTGALSEADSFEKVKMEFERMKREREADHQARKETSAILKVKLYEIKNAALVGQATAKLDEAATDPTTSKGATP